MALPVFPAITATLLALTRKFANLRALFLTAAAVPASVPALLASMATLEAVIPQLAILHAQSTNACTALTPPSAVPARAAITGALTRSLAWQLATPLVRTVPAIIHAKPALKTTA